MVDDKEKDRYPERSVNWLCDIIKNVENKMMYFYNTLKKINTFIETVALH